MVPLDLGLFLIRFGVAALPALDAALDSLEYITTHPVTVEQPSAGQELCISRHAHDQFWNDVLDGYLRRFPQFPRVLSNTKYSDIPQHRCSQYLLLEPESQPRQVFQRLQFLSVNGNWNQAARFIVAINMKRQARDLNHHLENFALMGIRNGVVLMWAPQTNRTFALFSRTIGQFEYAVTIEDLPPLLRRYSDPSLQGVTVGVGKRYEFPLLMTNGPRYSGVYHMFLKEFARKYHCKVAFQANPIHLVLTINSMERFAKPLTIEGFTGDCVVVPEQAKEGLVYYMLSPFSVPVWCLCAALVGMCLLLNWKFSSAFPNNILLTVLFGEQAGDGAYARHEHRVIFVAVVLMFFLSESYSAKLLSRFIDSLNEPHLKTLDALAASSIPLSVTNFVHIQSYEQLHDHLDVVGEDEQRENIRRGSHAFLVECGNAELMVHSVQLRLSRGYQVPHYILQEFIGWRLSGFMLSKFSAITPQMLRFTGRVSQAGLWAHWRQPFVHQLYYIRSRTLTYRETLYLKDLISLQYVLAGGYALAAVIFLLELAVYYFSKLCCTRNNDIHFR